VIRTETRHCPECGRPFIWTSRFANRRFCDPRCKAARWREAKNARRRELHRKRTTARTAAESIADDGNDAALEALGDHVDPVRQPSPPGAGTPVQNCPHCRNPVAVINLLVTPAAAYVNTPSPSVT
jgi:endogenous inhibitor of DNA gyrase (YacG/DUF329 family)